VHDIKEHINSECPECYTEALHWKGREIHCDKCGCSWTIEDLFTELADSINAEDQRVIDEANDNLKG